MNNGLKNWSCDQQGTFEHECEKPEANLNEYPKTKIVNAIQSNNTYCLLCEKAGHKTSDCNSTHGLNDLKNIEIKRLSDFEQHKNLLLAACRSAVLALAYASKNNLMFETTYTQVSNAIDEVTKGGAA